jgi:hypothetical protein
MPFLITRARPSLPQLKGDWPGHFGSDVRPATSLHPFVNPLCIIDDFGNRAVKAEEAIRYTDGIAGLCEAS